MKDKVRPSATVQESVRTARGSTPRRFSRGGAGFLLLSLLRAKKGGIMTNRRGRGEGSIAKRADGLWEARIDVGHDSHGKRLRKSVYGETKKECADKLTKLANRKLDGVLIDTGRMTVGNLLDRWLNDSARMNVAPTTFVQDATSASQRCH